MRTTRGDRWPRGVCAALLLTVGIASGCKDARSTIRWVHVHEADFLMGNPIGGNDNERPIHRVLLSPYRISGTEVTVAQYRACVKAGKCSRPKAPGRENDAEYCTYEKEGHDNHPVNCVDWHQAMSFAKWAIKGGRLPTEAQWENAAGIDKDRLKLATWYRDNSDEKVHPVATKAANYRGLNDMQGNLMEWVMDAGNTYEKGDFEKPPLNPLFEPRSNGTRVVRGCAFHSELTDCRRTRRFNLPATKSSFSVGFRIAVYVTPEE